MASENEAARQALGETVKALVERHGGVRAVARVLGNVDTYASQVSRWQRGQDVSLAALSLLAQKLNEEVTVTFTPTGTVEADAKESPPAWAEGLEERTGQIVATKLEDRLQQLEDSIAARVAEETSRLVLRSVEQTERDEDDPDQTDDQPHVAGQDG